MPRRRDQFDPRAILAALERNGVDYVLIGGLAQVIRGADIATASVDICPSFRAGNLDRVAAAVDELGLITSDDGVVELTEEMVGAKPVVSFSTRAGVLGIVGSPEGAPKGYVDLRRGATKEHLGHGVQPLVASVGDLARMASALHRDQDLERLPQLRRIIQLEADREQIARPTTPLRRPGRAASASSPRAQR